MNLVVNAQRSINYLTRSVDMGRMAMPYFMTFWHEGGMEYRHNPWDVVEDPGRFSAGVALARYMIGENRRSESERLWKEHLKSVWDDEFSLYAIPEGFQFVQSDPAAANCCGSVHTHDAKSTCNWDNRSVYLGLVLEGLLFGDEESIVMARRVIEGYKRWAVHDKSKKWCYYTSSGMTAKMMPDPEAPPVAGQEMGGILTALVKDYEWFGDATSLELAIGLANCMMHFAQIGQPWPPNYNTHSYYNYLAGLVRLYGKTSDRRYIDYAKRHFDHYTAKFASSFGWVTEFPDIDVMSSSPSSRRNELPVPCCEGCSAVDMIDTALMLAKHGCPEYWAVAERAIRNYLVKAQVSDPSVFPTSVLGEDTTDSSFKDIPSRLVGQLVGWGEPNDIVSFDNRTGRRVFQACCGAHCPYGIFQAWDNTVSQNGEHVAVNLGFDRETPLIKTVHTANSTGRFDIDVKQDCQLSVRVPEFVEGHQFAAMVDGKETRFDVDGLYARLGLLSRGSKVVLMYPLHKRVARETVPVYEKTYEVTWLGTDIVKMDPPGNLLPIFDGLVHPEPDCGATNDIFNF